jgi:hypothetical protein
MDSRFRGNDSVWMLEAFRLSQLCQDVGKIPVRLHNTRKHSVRDVQSRAEHFDHRQLPCWPDSCPFLVDQHLLRLDQCLLRDDQRLLRDDQRLLRVDQRLLRVDQCLLRVDQCLLPVDQSLLPIDQSLLRVDCPWIWAMLANTLQCYWGWETKGR